jgi:hypothetical protein
MDTRRNKEEILSRISQDNPLLASELNKLPELQNSVRDGAVFALENFACICRISPQAFNRIFEKMFQIGLPGYRKYCSPLQAFFWLIQDNHFEACEHLLGITIPRTLAQNQEEARYIIEPGSQVSSAPGEYSLKKLLDAAWHTEPLVLSEAQFREIVAGIQCDPEKEEYAHRLTHIDRTSLQNYIFKDFRRNRHIFEVNTRDYIIEALERSRWHSFYAVADRLNAPELVNYYINTSFKFSKASSKGVYFTFYFKTSQCTDSAYFTAYMLERAGYRTFIRSVKWSSHPWDGLHTGAGVVLDDGTYLLVSNYTGVNVPDGPFTTIADLDRILAINQNIIESCWGAYYPPRYF